MRKTASYLIPILSLLFFIFIMEGGFYYLTSLSSQDDIPTYIEQIQNDLKADQWDSAQLDLEKLDLAWKKAIPRLQFHAEMDAIDAIKENVARLHGSIEAQELGLSLAELNEMAEHWENIKN